MKQAFRITYLFLIPALLLAACTGVPVTGDNQGDAMDVPPAATEEMMEETSDEMMEETPDEAMDGESGDMMGETPTDAMGKSDDGMDETPVEMMEETADEMMEDDSMIDTPAWFGVELTDVRSGESFTISSLHGKVVLVENMAVWCTTCLRQQREVVKLIETLGESPDFVSVALDIDPNENGDQLKAYAEKNGFTWMYAVAPPEVAREIGELYGDMYLNPPSAPMLLIDKEGHVQPLPFGVKSVDDLKTAVDVLLNDGM